MDDQQLPARITAQKFQQALLDAGIVRRGDFVRRVVIDAEVGQPVMMYVERFGDSRLLSLVQTLKGVEIREELRPNIDVTSAEDDNKRYLPADA